MKYPGSKNRISKDILKILLPHHRAGNVWVEPFVGGSNMIDKIKGERIGGEFNQYIASMWIALTKGWVPPIIDRELYKEIRSNKEDYPKELVGWAGVACSYSGKWFGGFAGSVITAKGIRDYQAEAHKNLYNQLPNIKDIKYVHSCYSELELPTNATLYCDPPYANTLSYKDGFDSKAFWEWATDKALAGFTIFVSEYNAPSDWVCVWEKGVKSSLSANGNYGGSKASTERIFVHESSSIIKESL